MAENLVDVWNVATFDEDLLSRLRANAELIRNYTVTDKKNFLEREARTPKGPYLANPFGGSFQRFVEDVGRVMAARTIRAWHYTRLTDAEVDALRVGGIYLSTLETTRRRIDAQVAAGVLSAKIADALFAESPLHDSRQLGPRSDKFWLTAHPHRIDDCDVTLLLGNWGGEAVYFCLKDEKLKKLVAGIGKARVLEMAVPLNATCRAYQAGEAVVATFGRSLGCDADKRDFDLYATRPLSPGAVLAIHTKGERLFAKIAKGYPAEYPALA